MKLQVVTTTGVSVQLSARDFDEVPRVLGRIELPTPFTPQPPAVPASGGPAPVQGDGGRRRATAGPARPLTRAGRTASTRWPTTRCCGSGCGRRARPSGRPVRSRTCAPGSSGRSQSVSHRFDRVLRILETWGYVEGWTLSDAGRRLAGFFHECDLLVVEAVRQGHLDGLEPAELAGLASVFSYEHRSPEAPPTPWFPSREVRKRWEAIESLARELRVRRRRRPACPTTRAPDPTFVAIAHAWASGQSFATVVEDEELSGGDFVRTMKQLIDLLRQLALLAPSEATRASARRGRRPPVPRRRGGIDGHRRRRGRRR